MFLTTKFKLSLYESYIYKEYTSFFLPFYLSSFFPTSFFSHLLCELAAFHENNCHFYWNTRCVFSVIHHVQMRDAAVK